jgi:hypothetical protein
MLIDRPAEQPRQDHRMAEAADREKLGDALQDGNRERVESDHGCAGERAVRCWPLDAAPRRL